MAHTTCPNGHSMWNGDGKPVVYAFRTEYIREYSKMHPECILAENGVTPAMYDITDEAPQEDIDCWYCEECKGLVVFVDTLEERHDYKILDDVPDVRMSELKDWDEYIALRYWDFEEWDAFYAGMTPIQAIEQYDFKYRYMVSPDKEKIYAFDKDGNIMFGYFRSMYTKFS